LIFVGATLSIFGRKYGKSGDNFRHYMWQFWPEFGEHWRLLGNFGIISSERRGKIRDYFPGKWQAGAF
jgi:hypothetical protein